MKYLAALFVSLALSAQAVDYQIYPTTIEGSRHCSPTNYYTGYRINGTGSLASSQFGSADTTALIGTPVLTNQYILEWGQASSVAGATWTAKQWYQAQVVGSGIDSKHGHFNEGGARVDDNGVLVDPVTLDPDPTAMPQMSMDLENPWQDRWAYFEVEHVDQSTGLVIGTDTIAVGPGETFHLTKTAEAPFTSLPYLMVDGVRNSYGSGQNSSGGGGSGSTTSTPTTTGGYGSVTAGVDNLPTAVAGTTETKLAVDRVGLIINNANDDNKLGQAEIVRGLGAVKDAINGLSIGGGAGITADDVDEAVGNALGNNGDPTEGGLPTEFADSLADGEDMKSALDGIRTGITTLGTSATGMVDALGLGTTYGSEAWSYTIDLPLGIGTRTIDIEADYGWALTLIRNVIFGCTCFHFVGLFLKILRGALVG